MKILEDLLLECSVCWQFLCSC